MSTSIDQHVAISSLAMRLVESMSFTDFSLSSVDFVIGHLLHAELNSS